MWITITQPLLLKFPFLSRFPTSERCLTAEKTPGPWFFSWPKSPKSSPRGVDPFLERHSHSSTMGSTKKNRNLLRSIFDPRGTHQRATHHQLQFSVLARMFFEICWSFFELFGIIFEVFLGFFRIILKFFGFFGTILNFPECLSGGENVLKSGPLWIPLSL